MRYFNKIGEMNSKFSIKKQLSFIIIYNSWFYMVLFSPPFIYMNPNVIASHCEAELRNKDCQKCSAALLKIYKEIIRFHWGFKEAHLKYRGKDGESGAAIGIDRIIWIKTFPSILIPLLRGPIGVFLKVDNIYTFKI